MGPTAPISDKQGYHVPFYEVFAIESFREFDGEINNKIIGDTNI